MAKVEKYGSGTVKIAHPIKDSNGVQLEVGNGPVVTFDKNGEPGIRLGVESPSDLYKAIIREGKISLGVYVRDAIPFLVYDAIPESKNGEGLPEVGSVTGRANVNGFTMLEGIRKCLIGKNTWRIEERVGMDYLHLPFYLVRTDPPGSDRNVLIGLRREKIRRPQVEKIADAVDEQMKRYWSEEQVQEKTAGIAKQRGLNEMIQEIALEDNGRMTSMPGDIPESYEYS